MALLAAYREGLPAAVGGDLQAPEQTEVPLLGAGERPQLEHVVRADPDAVGLGLAPLRVDDRNLDPGVVLAGGGDRAHATLRYRRVASTANTALMPRAHATATTTRPRVGPPR